MITLKRKSKKILSWLSGEEEPQAKTIPSLSLFDKAITLLSKLSYISIRIFLRIVIGKEKREKLGFYRARINFSVTYSFYLFMYFYKTVRLLRLGNPTLIKLYVPKYDYKIYCPPTLNDFENMTAREAEILEHFCPQKGDTVIDVGAHLGRYALIGANRVGVHGKVVAIEAHPLVFEKLKKNIELNNFTNVMCLNYAVHSQENIKLKLFVPNKGLENNLYNTIVADRSKKRFLKENFIEVNANTLDNIIDSAGITPENVKWIKIDVEGAELEVLKGAHNILTKSKDLALLIEIHNISDGRNLYDDIMDLVKAYNFKLEFEKILDIGEGHIIIKK
ncbi:MAG: FkbM family methyltransferase [Nitrososphaeraceae archaeon]